MSAEIEIRAIEPADAVAVSHLISQAGYQRSPLEVCDWIDLLHRESYRQVALAVIVELQPVALVEVSIEHHLQRPPFATIVCLAVEKRFRNHGFRRLLCARAEEWAWMHGVNAIRANSHKSSSESHHFYLEAGFHETREYLVFEKPRPH